MASIKRNANLMNRLTNSDSSSTSGGNMTHYKVHEKDIFLKVLLVTFICPRFLNSRLLPNEDQ
jgi:hypothetical protein